MGRKTLWQRGLKTDPCYLAYNTPAGKLFFSSIIAYNYEKFKRYWLKKVFSGYGTAPYPLRTTERIINFVSKNKGGIGIIEASKINMIRNKNCKVITLK